MDHPLGSHWSLFPGGWPAAHLQQYCRGVQEAGLVLHDSLVGSRTPWAGRAASYLLYCLQATSLQVNDDS